MSSNNMKSSFSSNHKEGARSDNTNSSGIKTVSGSTATTQQKSNMRLSGVRDIIVRISTALDTVKTVSDMG